MLYPASRGFSLARLLAIMKSFASLVSHVVGFCVGVNKPTTQLKDFANAKAMQERILCSQGSHHAGEQGIQWDRQTKELTSFKIKAISFACFHLAHILLSSVVVL